MSKIILYGASGHGRVVASIAKNNDVTVDAFVDDNPNSSAIKGIKVYQPEALPSFNQKVIISIGNNRIRKTIHQKIKASFTQLTHNTAVIDASVTIEEGTVIMPRVVVNCDTHIGKHVILNTAAVVEHDCSIKDFVHVSPNVTIAGSVTVGEGTHIGAGAVILPNTTIGKWVTIGAGATVIKDVPDYAVVVGNPARIIKYNEAE